MPKFPSNPFPSKLSAAKETKYVQVPLFRIPSGPRVSVGNYISSEGRYLPDGEMNFFELHRRLILTIPVQSAVGERVKKKPPFLKQIDVKLLKIQSTLKFRLKHGQYFTIGQNRI